MATKKPTEMSDAELQKNASVLKAVLYALAALNILLLVLVIANFTKKGMTPLLVVPLGLSPILILSANTLKSLNKEIAARKL